MFALDGNGVLKVVLDLLEQQYLFGGGHGMEAAVKESARQNRLLVRQYMGKASVEILHDVPLPEEDTVLRHDIELP